MKYKYAFGTQFVTVLCWDYSKCSFNCQKPYLEACQSNQDYIGNFPYYFLPFIPLLKVPVILFFFKLSIEDPIISSIPVSRKLQCFLTLRRSLTPYLDSCITSGKLDRTRLFCLPKPVTLVIYQYGGWFSNLIT